LIRIWLKLTALRARELTITEEKNKKEDKISQQEVVLKKQTVELEKSSFDSGNAKEIKITLIRR
jgi:hypothetical protein